MAGISKDIRTVFIPRNSQVLPSRCVFEIDDLPFQLQGPGLQTVIGEGVPTAIDVSGRLIQRDKAIVVLAVEIVVGIFLELHRL